MNVFSIIGLVIAISMFFIPRVWKITMLFVGFICFSLVEIPFFPGGTARVVFCYMFFFSELKHIKKHCGTLSKSIIWKLLVIQFVAVIISISTSPHFNLSIRCILDLIYELLGSEIIIAYAYLSIKNEKSLKILLNGSFAALLLLTFFGVINFILRRADFVTYCMQDISNLTDVAELMGEKFSSSDRFRVQAMFFNPFDYGYICLMLLILHAYGYFRKIENKNIAYAAIACCIFGIFTCGCRTVFFCFVIGGVVFVFKAFKIGRTIRYLLMSIVVGIVLYCFVPVVQHKVDETLTAFTDVRGEKVGGSSIELRTAQFAAVLYHIDGHEWFGRGRGYFVIDLGWGEGTKHLADDRLAGLEGVYLHYLLENGVVGLLLWSLFYILLVAYYVRIKKNNKIASAAGLSVVVVYMSFSCMTGQLLSLYPTMLLSGVFMKLTNIAKRKNEILINNSSIQKSLSC